MEAIVLEVYQGDSSIVGETICYQSNFYFYTNDIEIGQPGLCTGTLVNYMKKDNEYLISMSQWIAPKGWRDDGNQYYYNAELSPIPYLNFKDIPNVFVEGALERKVPPKYKEMSGNEVFAINQKSMDSFITLKHRIFEFYSIQ